MYRIDIERRAAKELQGIEGKQRNRILDVIDSLKNDPRPSGCKKLRRREGWRIRASDYRVIYTIDDVRQRVWVIKVGHRREVYKDF